MISNQPNMQLVRLVELGSEAGYYGALVSSSIHQGHSIDTIVLWARFAARYANKALRDAGASYND